MGAGMGRYRSGGPEVLGGSGEVVGASAMLAASLTKLSTAGLVSSARQATHSVVGGTSLAGTKTMPGRALNSPADAGHKLMPRPAAMCSRHSSIVWPTAPMTG